VLGNRRNPAAGSVTEAEQPFRRRLLANTGAVGLSNLWAIIISVIALPLTLHGLGTEAFGTWVLLNTFSAMSGWFSLADLGVGTAATREVATRASGDEQLGVSHAIASALVLFGGLGLIFAVLFAAIGPAVLPHVFSTPKDLVTALQFAIVVFAVQVLVDQLTNAAEAALDGLQRVDLSRAVDAFRRTAVAIAVAVVAMAGGGLEGVALASLAGSLAGAVVAGAVLHHQHRGHWARPQLAVMRSLLSYGKSIAVLQPLGVITRQMDRLIAGAILGPTAVTLVEIATQVQNGASAVLAASSYVATPASAWVQARDEKGLLRELVVRGTKYSLLITYPVTIGAAILAPDLVHVWVGPTYAAAAGLTVLALLDILLSGPLQVGSNVLIGVGRAPEVLKAAVGAVLINLVASVVLVHLVGAAGVFLGTLLGLAFLVPFLGRAICRQVEVSPRTFVSDSVWPALLACIPMAVVVGGIEALPLPPLTTLVLGAGTGAALYLATVFILVLSRDERDELRATLRRRRRAPDTASGPEPGLDET
jgi:O-antigen/teichoic acid export membrane protein